MFYETYLTIFLNFGFKVAAIDAMFFGKMNEINR
jgi:hypothetical protein